MRRAILIGFIVGLLVGGFAALTLGLSRLDSKGVPDPGVRPVPQPGSTVVLPEAYR